MFCPTAVVESTQIPIQPVAATDADVQLRIVLVDTVFKPPSRRIPSIRPVPEFRFAMVLPVIELVVVAVLANTPQVSPPVLLFIELGVVALPMALPVMI